MSLIGLPETFRFAIFNQTGISISSAPVGVPKVAGIRVRLTDSGVMSYEAASFTFFSTNQGSIGNNSYVVGSTLSNTASGWLGGEFHLSCFASGNASGNIFLYLEASVDGGTTWPTPASANGGGGGRLVAFANYGSSTTASTASTTQRIYFDL